MRHGMASELGFLVMVHACSRQKIGLIASVHRSKVEDSSIVCPSTVTLSSQTIDGRFHDDVYMHLNLRSSQWSVEFGGSACYSALTTLAMPNNASVGGRYLRIMNSSWYASAVAAAITTDTML